MGNKYVGTETSRLASTKVPALGELGFTEAGVFPGDGTTQGKNLAALLRAIRTATSGGLGISPNPVNSIGPSADSYTVLGGETTFPHSIGNSRLSNFAGYDNHNWDNAIAAVNHGHHGVTGSTAGHPGILSGSLAACIGGYGVVAGGTGHMLVSAKSGIGSGDSNSAGANVITTLTSASAVGDTTLTVASVTGVAVGQIGYLGMGTTGLDNGSGPLERARVASIAGNVVTFDTFQAVSTTDATGASTGTAFTAVHPSGTKVFFADGSHTGAVVAGGYLNDAQGQYSAVLGGRQNTASGLYSVAEGFSNTASGVGSTARGQYATAAWYGEHATSSSQAGQSSHIDVTATTTDGTTAVAVNGPGTGGSTYQLQRGQTVKFRGELVARSAGGADRFSVSFERLAHFESTGNSVWDSDPAIITTMGTVPGSAAVTFTAGSSVGTVKVLVTGKASTTLQWSGRIYLVTNTLS